MKIELPKRLAENIERFTGRTWLTYNDQQALIAPVPPIFKRLEQLIAAD